MADAGVSHKTIDALLKPKTVAVLGASGNPNKLGFLQVQALLDGGYEGEIYPINPGRDTIVDLQCYKSLSEVPKQVDLAIFCVSADNAEECLIDCGKNGVKAAILFASGYAETGAEGVKKQERLEKIAKDYRIRMIGPNCVGLVNTTNGLVSTFSPGLTELPLSDKREVGFITQSGAFGVLTYIAAAQAGLTFNYFVSVGNEAEIKFSDLVEYMIHDEQTGVISGYLEGEKEPKRLQRLAKLALEKNKPIVIMKSGRSSAGSRAAVSHTGSLAGSDRIYNDFFRQTGIVRADDYEDIISFSKLHLSRKLPKGRNTVIITSSGGRGINETDRCEAYGLHVINLKKSTQEAIQKRVPDFGSVANPIDLTAAAAVTHPQLIIEPLKELIHDPEVDTIIYTEFPMDWGPDNPYLKEFIDLCNKTDKLIFISTFPLSGMDIPDGTEVLEDNGIPVITGDLNPIRSLAKLVDYSEKYQSVVNDKQKEQRVVQKWQDMTHLFSSGKSLSESQACSVLERYGIATAKKGVASSSKEAINLANQIGYPVAMKIDSPDIPHKTEAKAVQLNVNNDAEVAKAFDEIMRNTSAYDAHAHIEGVSVQQMLSEGVEVIAGMSNDPVFGPVVMFGLGGVFVEIFEDISFRIAPLRRIDALEMIMETKGYQVLQGARGEAPVDIEAIVDVLLRLSDLVIEHQDDIEELDINPLIVYEKGAIAADAMIVGKETETKSMMGG